MDYTFLSENYIWIIVVAVIVVMTIIGYIADKTNFGEKKPKKQMKEKEITNDENVLVEQDNIVNDSFNDYQNMNSFDMPLVEENNEELAFSDSQVIEPVQPEMIEPETVESVQSEIIEPETVETMQSEPILDDFEISESEATDYLQDDIYDQDIAVDDDNFVNSEENSFENYEVEQPLEMETPISEEQPVEPSIVEQPTEEIEPVQPEEIDFELPNIDQLNEEIAGVEEDEDVWKF